MRAVHARMIAEGMYDASIDARGRAEVVPAAPNVRAKPRVQELDRTRTKNRRHVTLYKSTTYDIGSWRAGDNGRTPGPGWRKCTAYRQTGPGGLPLALRLSEGLGLSAADRE